VSFAIDFYAGQGFSINDLAGSGLGFYGAGNFGTPVLVGSYNDNTYITDATGAVNGPKVNNVKYVHPASGQLSTGDIHALQDIPNYLASLNIRFTNDTPCQVTNAQVRIFDRASINSPASGVTCKVAQLIHPGTSMLPSGPLGSGDVQWWTPGGSGGYIGGTTYDPPVALVSGPGSGGWSPSGAATVDTRHDWYVALSATPTSIGSKQQFGLYVSLEYL
jgi:hypothetical protein